ncbi:MAG: hypothetical protein L0Z62_01640 [Gemmataceae bacterium]|nr:hypothetical protein [Gemmataceae bacterium]
MIEEAAALRALLRDASGRAGQLLVTLKKYRQRSQLVQAAVVSLRQLPLDP